MFLGLELHLTFEAVFSISALALHYHWGVYVMVGILTNLNNICHLGKWVLWWTEGWPRRDACNLGILPYVGNDVIKLKIWGTLSWIIR